MIHLALVPFSHCGHQSLVSQTLPTPPLRQSDVIHSMLKFSKGHRCKAHPRPVFHQRELRAPLECPQPFEPVVQACTIVCLFGECPSRRGHTEPGPPPSARVPSSTWAPGLSTWPFFWLPHPAQLTMVGKMSPMTPFYPNREEIEKQKAKERYMKMHLAGKTEQAKADLARLAIIRKQREEAARKKEEERKGKS